MRTIYARNTSVGNLTPEIAQEFVAQYHHQGAVEMGLISASVGLLGPDDELVAVAQFCPVRTSGMAQRYSTEWIRLAFKSDVRVVGGASKLFSFYTGSRTVYDVFTYQDATGELTDVYEHCGMTLVRDGGTKQYLVAPGKTFDTGGRKEVLGMPYATRYGPDRILGTSLGEVYHADGSRKSNEDIFLEDLGWHIEETPGDRIYEWFNPDITHYVYRISATERDEYYYGVSHIKRAHASIDECMQDGYFGSGRTRLENWKATLEPGTMQKEVLGLFSTRARAYAAEKELIGDLYTADPLCLNAMPGGSANAWRGYIFQDKECGEHGLVPHRAGHCVRCTVQGTYQIQECIVHGPSPSSGGKCARCRVNAVWDLQECPIHGESWHQKNRCQTCTAQSSIRVLECPKHGRTKHIGVSCCRCSSEFANTMAYCDIHGEGKHIGPICRRCTSYDAWNFQECDVHGESWHIGDRCSKCSSASTWKLEECAIHGESWHQGGRCQRCVSVSGYKLRECSIHGMVMHNGYSCATCRVQRSFTEKECSTHGLCTHQGEQCLSCVALRRLVYQECAIHGEALHQGDSCCKCATDSAYTLQECSVHGWVKFCGDSCATCRANEPYSEQRCEVHGLTKHQSGNCVRCFVEEMISERECPKHGLTAHRGATCCACTSFSSISLQQCDIHGMTKHSGESCYKCRGELSAHKRGSHDIYASRTCIKCVSIIEPDHMKYRCEGWTEDGAAYLSEHKVPIVSALELYENGEPDVIELVRRYKLQLSV